MERTLKVGEVKCKGCGTIIQVSVGDWKNKTAPEYCPKCRLKPKRGNYKTLEQAEKEDGGIFGTKKPKETKKESDKNE